MSEAITDAPPGPPGAGKTDFTPHVPADQHPPEFTIQALLVGAVLGIIFGASSLYLVLRIGLTVSASIPVAVLSITMFRALGGRFGIRKATILENNITQTTGSAGESIAFGVGVTMPALLLIGFEMSLARVMVVSLLGGLLGILMMIPLRRAFIVNMHGRPGEPGKLLYPEGTACAQVLISGEKGGSGGLAVLVGFLVAFAHKFITEGMHLIGDAVAAPLAFFSKAARVSADMGSELIGVGYIIGVRTGAIMLAGAVLGWLVIVPTVFLEGEAAGLAPGGIYKKYLREIGAGCVAAAGIISMGRTLPMIIRSFGFGGKRATAVAVSQDRTERDLPPSFVLGGALLLLAALSAFLLPEVGPVPAILGAVLVLVFGFLFVTVSSRLTGEIGSSSNPISGMTVATLLLTCLIFLVLGMTTKNDAVLALSIGGVVCIAASNGGTTSQDLKTGYLVGGTPYLQQWAIIIGAVTSALVIGVTLTVFASAGIIYSKRDLPKENVKAKLAEDAPRFDHEDKTYTVWYGGKNEKYLVDAEGWVTYRVDPTITGTLKKRDTFAKPESPITAKLTADELKRLKSTASLRADETGPPVVYKIWTNAKPADGAKFKPGEEPVHREDVPEGEYLVNDNGEVTHVVSGEEVRMKFPAPKTEVMGVIINGLLQQNLNWTLILIGAFIAVSLELCGVSSLAFAVGLYVPMQVSTTIFLGGVVRWFVDGYHARRSHAELGGDDSPEARARAEVDAIRKSETSSGTLLSSGYIAGGSLAGVLIAFLSLPAFEVVKKAMDQSRATQGGEEPLFTLEHWGIDFAPLPLFVALLAFLLVVGLGIVMKPKDEASA